MTTLRRFLKALALVAATAALANQLPTAAGQRILHPVRVAVRAPDNEVNATISAAVRERLRGLPERDVVLTDSAADLEINLNAAPLVSVKCEGYVTAVAVVERASARAELQAYSGPTPQAVAGYLVETVVREHFERTRAQALRRGR